MSERQKAFISVFLGAVLGGATAPITKIGLTEIPPLSFAFIRFVIASIIILPFFVKKNTLNDFIKQIPLSVFGAVNITFFILGIKITTANNSQVLYSAIPLLATIISYLFLKEKIKFEKLLGIAVGFLGVVLVIILPLIEHNKFSGSFLGNVLISVGVISWSFYMVFSKKAQNNFSPFSITSAFIFTTTLFLFPLFLFDLKSNSNWLSSLTFAGFFSLFYVAIIATIITYILNQYAIKHGGSIFASMIFYITPIFGFISALVLIGERLTGGVILGTAIALFGVYTVTRKK